MVRVLGWMAFLVVMALTQAVVAQPKEGRVAGDPFATPLSLAGTWRYQGDGLTVERGRAADLADWHDVTIPSKRVGETGPVVWYGLDAQLPPKADWPRDEPLALLLPPFLVAYRVYVGGEVVGESGRLDTLRRGVNRHRLWPVPARLIGADGMLKLRVEAAVGSHKGTYSSSRPDGVALGRQSAMEQLAELTQRRIETVPRLRVRAAMRLVFLGIALLQLMLFLLDRRRTAYGWYALMLIASAANGYCETVDELGAVEPDAIRIPSVLLLAISVSAAFKMLGAMLDLPGRLVNMAVALPWLAPITVLIAALPGMSQETPAIRLFLNLFGLVIIFTGLWLIGRGWRARHPDARALAKGLGLALLLILGDSALYLATDARAHGGWAAPWRLALSTAASLTALGTAAVVLAMRYQRAFRDVERAHHASQRFVPAAFLTLLGRENVVAVERGDTSAEEMTVLFSDIRGFTKLSEQRSPEDNFGFINRYLARMEPCITDHAGFINQYYGDGIMALFPTADGAARAAAAMQREVDALSDELEREGHDRLRVGVGLHSGPLMLGTIGGAARLDTGVIGDAVNLASRVEGMTKRYGCRVLLSGATQDRLAEHGGIALRELDRVRVVGRDDPVLVYQLVEAEDDATRKAVVACLSDFAEGLAAYRKGAFDAAATLFEKVLASVDDGPARSLLAACHANAGRAAEWDGVTQLESK